MTGSRSRPLGAMCFFTASAHFCFQYGRWINTELSLTELWFARASFLNLLQLAQREWGRSSLAPEVITAWSLCLCVREFSGPGWGLSCCESSYPLYGSALGIRSLHSPIFRAANFSSRWGQSPWVSAGWGVCVWG